MLDGVSSEWVDFQQCIIDSEQSLKKHKERFKTGLMSQAEEFRKKVNSLTSEFSEDGPFNSQWQISEAVDKIEEFKWVLDASERWYQDFVLLDNP